VALVIAVQKGFRVVITGIINAVVWRAPTSVSVSGGSCGATSFKNPCAHGQGVSKGGAPVTGASSVRVIAERGSSPLLVNGHLNGCGLGLAVAEQVLLLDMRASGQSDSHGALHNVTSQGVVTWQSAEAVRALGHGEREVWCGWVVEGVTTNGGKWFSLGQKLQRPRGPVCSQMTYIWIQITNYEGQGGHVHSQMTHIWHRCLPSGRGQL
jgi:hypothetical protein